MKSNRRTSIQPIEKKDYCVISGGQLPGGAGVAGCGLTAPLEEDIDLRDDGHSHHMANDDTVYRIIALGVGSISLLLVALVVFEFPCLGDARARRPDGGLGGVG
jgi:hypothetical protein